MHLELTEDQEFFRQTTRKFLESEVPLTAVRALYESRDGFERRWWRKAAELGWTSLFVPEAHGGGNLSGDPTRDAVIVAEEMGRLVSPGPFLPVNVVAAALRLVRLGQPSRPTSSRARLRATQSPPGPSASRGSRWEPEALWPRPPPSRATR